MTTTDTTTQHRGIALDLPVDRWIPITKAYAAFDGPFPVAVTFDDGEFDRLVVGGMSTARLPLG